MGTAKASGELNYLESANTFQQWDGDDTQSRNIGTAIPAKTLMLGKVGGKRKGEGPPEHDISLDTKAAFAGVGPLTCQKKRKRCKHEDFDCNYNICANNVGYCEVDGDDDAVERRRDLLEKRDGPRPHDVEFSDGTEITVESRPYKGVSKLWDGRNGARVLDRVFSYVHERNRSNAEVLDYEKPSNGFGGFVTEHIVELQMVSMFLRAAESGKLMSGATMQTRPIPASFFERYWNEDSLSEVAGAEPVVPELNNYRSRNPNTRVFEALGSVTNRQNFVALRSDINTAKKFLWVGANPFGIRDFEAEVSNWIVDCEDPGRFLKKIKTAISVFYYLTDDVDVNFRLKNTIALVRDQLALIQQDLTDGAGLLDAWNEFIV